MTTSSGTLRVPWRPSATLSQPPGGSCGSTGRRPPPRQLPWSAESVSDGTSSASVPTTSQRPTSPSQPADVPLFRSGKPHRLLRLSADTAYTAPDADVPFDTFSTEGVFGPSTGGGLVEIEVDGLYLMLLGLRRVVAAASSSFQAIITVDGTERVRDTFQTGNGPA